MSTYRLVLALLALLSVDAWATPCPNVMLVLDKTGSMSYTKIGNQSLWEITQQAVSTILTTPVAGETITYGDKLPWGLLMFSFSGFGGDSACYDSTAVSVSAAHDTAQTIISIVNGVTDDQVTGTTNTGEGIKRAASDAPMKDTTRGQYIILITDGDPNCNSGDGGGSATYTVSQIAAAAAQNPPVHTFVIGFNAPGTDVKPVNLNAMAIAGKQERANCNKSNDETQISANPCYYVASDPTKLNEALDAIIKQVSGGEFSTGICDDSCFSNGCPQGQRCSVDEITHKPVCINDPCANVAGTCDEDEYCRDGRCVPICTKACKANQMCVDGSCVPNPCVDVTCSPDYICDPLTGGCVLDKCNPPKTCDQNKACDFRTGECVEDLCAIISCPAGTVCRTGGNCESTDGADSEGGGSIKGRSEVGCSTTRTTDVGGVAAAALLLLGLALVQRRRR